LRPIQAAAVHGVLDLYALGALQRVAHGQSRQHSGRVLERGEDAVDQSAVDKRPYPIMDEDALETGVRQALEAKPH
jgi:hypothetical protein